MAELELYWPFPLRYCLTDKPTIEQSKCNENKSKFALEKPFQGSADKLPAVAGGVADLMSQLKSKEVVLYTWPLSAVSKTRWYTIPGNDNEADLVVPLQRRRSSAVVAKVRQDHLRRRQSAHGDIEAINGRDRWLEPTLNSSALKPDIKNEDIRNVLPMEIVKAPQSTDNALNQISSRSKGGMIAAAHCSIFDASAAAKATTLDLVAKSDDNDTAFRSHNMKFASGALKLSAWDSIELTKVAARRFSRTQIDEPRKVSIKSNASLENESELCHARPKQSSKSTEAANSNGDMVTGSYNPLVMHIDDKKGTMLRQPLVWPTVPSSVGFSETNLMLEQVIKTEFRNQHDTIKSMEEDHAHAIVTSIEVINQLRDEVRQLSETLMREITASRPLLPPSEINAIDSLGSATPTPLPDSEQESVTGQYVSVLLACLVIYSSFVIILPQKSAQNDGCALTS